MRRRGFTLLELLVAMALGVMLAALTAQVFSASLRTRERLREVGSGVEHLRRAYEIISRDLHSATIPPDDSGLQFGLQATPARLGNSVLQLASVIGEPLLVGREANETVLIQYAVAEDPETGRPAFWRHETPYPIPETAQDTLTTPETRSMILLPGVTGATYLFYSLPQQAWVETWDEEPGLPAAIRIDLALEARERTGAARVESWVFAIPAALYESEEGGDAEGEESGEPESEGAP